MFSGRGLEVDQQKQLEKMVLACIDTAQTMLDEYGAVVPFGLRAYSDNEDMKMNCPAEEKNKTDWDKMIKAVVAELKDFVEAENVVATAVVTTLQANEEHAVGLQIETELSSVLFVYPYSKVDDEWVIDEPVKTEQLLDCVYTR